MKIFLFLAMALLLRPCPITAKYKGRSLKRFPLSTIPVDLDTAKNVMKLVDMLEDDEDVNAVYHNMELSEEVEAELANG